MQLVRCVVVLPHDLAGRVDPRRGRLIGPGDIDGRVALGEVFPTMHEAVEPVARPVRSDDVAAGVDPQGRGAAVGE